MFGPEASGLSNKDLSFSNYIYKFQPLKFKSLNLSHSLTLVCYDLKMNFKNSKRILKLKFPPKEKSLNY